MRIHSVGLQGLIGPAFALAICGSASAQEGNYGPPSPTAAEIAKAKSGVLNQLIDPESGRLQDVFFKRNGPYPTFCGAVNGKNKVGGYVGAQPFIVFGNDVTVYQGRPGTQAAFTRMWSLACAGGQQVQLPNF